MEAINSLDMKPIERHNSLSLILFDLIRVLYSSNFNERIYFAFKKLDSDINCLRFPSMSERIEIEEVVVPKKKVSSSFLFLRDARSPSFPNMISINPTWGLNALLLFCVTPLPPRGSASL